MWFNGTGVARRGGMVAISRFSLRSKRTWVLSAALLLAPTIAGCAAAEPDAEELAATHNAISGTIKVGASVSTTARVNLREEPSMGDNIIRTMPAGAVVTAIEASPQNGFYHVSYDGDEGWASGKYLKGATSAPNDDDDADGTPGAAGSSSGGTPTGQGETCKASFYDEGQQTANGERFDPNALTAAHKTLKFNTRVRVTNPSTGKSVVVRINDRGPFVAGRCLDLSRAAFATIGSVSAGVMTVRYEVLR